MRIEPTTLRRRYLSLWTGEAAASLVFATLLASGVIRSRDWPAWLLRIASLAIVVLILLQAVGWWRAKLAALDRGDRRLPAATLRVYRRWRTVNWWLIGAWPLLALLVGQLGTRPLVTTDSVVGLLILAGAVIEQINYYYFQLRYDFDPDRQWRRTQRRLRRGTIARALADEDDP